MFPNVGEDSTNQDAPRPSNRLSLAHGEGGSVAPREAPILQPVGFRSSRRFNGGSKLKTRVKDVMAARRVLVFRSSAELGPVLAQLVSSRAEAAVSARGRFTVGVSGGGLVTLLSRELLLLRPGGPDCSRWLLGYCDERLVPFSDPESTHGLYQEHLYSKVNIPEGGVLSIQPELPVSQCAEDYSRRLQQAFPEDPVPVFDLLLLGMGPDGHTCSLFPGHPLLEETEKIVAPISDSPKPPPQRVTLTLPVVNAARCVAFVSTGGSKATVLKEVLEGGEGPALPAARVAPTRGELLWLLDEPAAAALSVPVERPGPGAKVWAEPQSAAVETS